MKRVLLTGIIDSYLRVYSITRLIASYDSPLPAVFSKLTHPFSD
jgi:hypothetical protein